MSGPTTIDVWLQTERGRGLAIGDGSNNHKECRFLAEPELNVHSCLLYS